MLASDWDIAAPFMRYSTLTSGALTTLRLSGFLPLSRVPLSLTVYRPTVMTAKEPELTSLTVKLMAEKYQVSEFTLRQLARDQRIPFIKVGRNFWIGEPSIKGGTEGWEHAHSYLTVKQAEDKYQVSENTLRHAIREQQIPHVYIGGSVRIREFCDHCGEIKGLMPRISTEPPPPWENWDSSDLMPRGRRNGSVLAPLQKGR